MGPSLNGGPPDRGADPERLRTLLNPVFDRPVADRPYPGDLLQVLRDTSVQRAAHNPEEHLEAARRQFDHISAAKHRPPPPAAPPATAQSARRARRWFLSLLAFVHLLTVLR
jgi:hypothetical protein